MNQLCQNFRGKTLEMMYFICMALFVASATPSYIRVVADSSTAVRSVTIGSKILTLFPGNEGNLAEAEKFCRSLGMAVGEIHNQVENDMVISEANKMNLQGRQAFWMGATAVVMRGTFVWGSTGIPLVYSNWGTGEPSNSGGTEMCLSLYKDVHHPLYHWNDLDCDNISKFFCQRTKGVVEISR